jgi:Uncharacterized phage-associated protein
MTYITIHEIQQILKDYRIGKKPLAKLLGWGETTIIRYIDGDIPTVEYSNKLKEILYNPRYFYQLLLENRDNLTNVAFKKSRQSVLEKIMESKINLVAQYIINEADADISASRLQSLLYYIQGFHLAFYDTPMFQDEFTITALNVPYPKIYSDTKSRSIICLEMKDNSLTKEEIKLIKNVMDAFSWYGYRGLSAMAAEEKALYRISRDKENNRIISKEIIKANFKDIRKKYEIDEVDEICRYPDVRILELKKSF